MDASGRAFGVLCTLQLAPVAASNGVSDLPKALAYMRVARRPGRDARERHRAVHRLDHRLSGAVAGLTALAAREIRCLRVALPRRLSHVHLPVPACRSEAGLARLPRAPARRRRAPDRRPGRARARAGELGRRIESALAGGVRWLILDLAEAVDVTDTVLGGARRGRRRAAGAQGRADRRRRAAVASRSGSRLRRRPPPGRRRERRPGRDDPQDAAAQDRHPPPAAARQAAHLVADAAADRAAPPGR